MMLLTHIRDNHLYLVFQDFEDKVEDIYKAIKVFPPKASIRVLAKLGSDALASPFDEAKAIVSDEFCKYTR